MDIETDARRAEVRLRRGRGALASLLVVGVLGVVAGSATYAAFLGTTANAGNGFAAGSVTLSDNDAGAAVLTLTDARPGGSSSGCIAVTYSGSLPATVRIYGAAAGSLAPYLDLEIARGGDGAPSFPSCAGFAADATNYVGAGAGVLYSGALSAFPASYAASADEPTAGAPETWTTSETHVYRVTVTLRASAPAAAQGLSSTVTLTWEARNQ